MKKKRDYAGFMVFLSVGAISVLLSAAGALVNWAKAVATNSALICLTALFSILWLIAGYRAARTAINQEKKPG